MNEMTTAQRKCAVITGGAGGMGLATARIMGANQRVILVDVNQQKLDAAAEELAQANIECDRRICDITNRQSVDDLVKEVSGQGDVTSLVHTAGLSPQMANAEMIMKVNAMGTINVNEAFYDIAHDGFSVVNVASMAAHLLPGFIIPRRSYKYAFTDKETFFRKMMFRCNMLPQKARTGMAYSLSKNFVTWYSKKQAKKFGDKGARILSVSPGSIDTEMGRLEEKTGSAAMLEFAAIKRFGKAEEIAELLAFCAGDKASYMTGIDIPCDGGVTATITLKDLRSVAM